MKSYRFYSTTTSFILMTSWWIGWTMVSFSFNMGSVQAIRDLQFVSPLQSLTIPEHHDNDDNDSNNEIPFTARGRFLQKLSLGIKAEQLLKQQQQQQQQQQKKESMATMDTTTTNTQQSDWAQQASLIAQRNQRKEERMLEDAYDKAIAPLEQKYHQYRNNKKKNHKKQQQQQQHKYQFVGIIQPNSKQSNNDNNNNKIIQWYARPKPKQSQWSVRLIHVNRDAILYDLFQQGKIDIFGRYDNMGIPKVDTTTTTTTSTTENTNVPIIRSQYIVRERSWKNLWNFSMKHFFTDSSGMYWRERRLPDGYYTDGTNVYSSTYRYRDGRNGMHRISSLTQFLSSPNIPESLKKKIQKRLQLDSPDIVLEE